LSGAAISAVLRVYIGHDNRRRPHRALRLEAPDAACGLTIASEGHPG
jgi:hypothetical protein